MASDEVPIPDPVMGIGAVLGDNIEPEDVLPPVLEPELLPLVDRHFDTATYQIHTHVLTPGDILRFKGLIPGIDEDILLREPAEHLSADAPTVIAVRIGSYGSIFDPRHWYERLPVEVRTLVDATSFGLFCSGFIQMRVKPLLYEALVERWWDTTD
ncbi:hypothetical protein ACSBR1_004716 [Camellia fascicularis]